MKLKRWSGAGPWEGGVGQADGAGVEAGADASAAGEAAGMAKKGEKAAGMWM